MLGTISDEVVLIPNIPAAGGVGALQQQFNAFQQQANENHQQLVRILTHVQNEYLCLHLTRQHD
jgi:hypothetical protein